MRASRSYKPKQSSGSHVRSGLISGSATFVHPGVDYTYIFLNNCIFLNIHKKMAKITEWTCPLCRIVFVGKHKIALHRKNFFKLSTDPSRCDYIADDPTDTDASSPAPSSCDNITDDASSGKGFYTAPTSGQNIKPREESNLQLDLTRGTSCSCTWLHDVPFLCLEPIFG